MANIIPNPDNLSWQQWAMTVVGYNPVFGQYLHPSMEWQDFGRKLQYLVPQSPRPELFSSWQPWASAVKQVLAS